MAVRRHSHAERRNPAGYGACGTAAARILGAEGAVLEPERRQLLHQTNWVRSQSGHRRRTASDNVALSRAPTHRGSTGRDGG
jgi:hypothetical protein